MAEKEKGQVSPKKRNQRGRHVALITKTTDSNNNGSRHALGALFWSWHRARRLACAAVFNAHNKYTWSALLLSPVIKWRAKN